MPVSNPEILLARLEAIAASLERSGGAQALIGLGSAGLETSRLDRFSDLDFFAVVDDECKNRYLDDLSWLSSICAIDFSYRNTRDGHKVLFRDGVFCEFAVFETPELRQIPFAPGRIVWKRPDLPDALLAPEPERYTPAEHSTDWLLGEALTNLYAGLSRDARGETLSAMRCIQVYAVDRTIELASRLAPATQSARDPFALERRFEQRYPGFAPVLPRLMQGYSSNVESARAILVFLETNFAVDPAMKRAIEALCDARPVARGDEDGC
jgi:hypothetical protein